MMSLTIASGMVSRASCRASSPSPAESVWKPRRASRNASSLAWIASSSTISTRRPSPKRAGMELLCGRCARTTWRRRETSSGLVMTSLKPTAEMRAASLSESRPESASIGTSAPPGKSRRRVTRSKPSMSGSMVSCSTTSLAPCSHSPSACAPLWASITRMSSDSSAEHTNRHMMGLSSTKRTRATFISAEPSLCVFIVPPRRARSLERHHSAQFVTEIRPCAAGVAPSSRGCLHHPGE